MNEEKIPECPDGHGEMVPAMGEVKIRRDKEDRAELGVRDLRENCYFTLPLNSRCASPESILFHPDNPRPAASAAG
jgi:hypothetical protein